MKFILSAKLSLAERSRSQHFANIFFKQTAFFSLERLKNEIYFDT